MRSIKLPTVISCFFFFSLPLVFFHTMIVIIIILFFFVLYFFFFNDYFLFPPSTTRQIRSAAPCRLHRPPVRVRCKLHVFRSARRGLRRRRRRRRFFVPSPLPLRARFVQPCIGKCTYLYESLCISNITAYTYT